MNYSQLHFALRAALSVLCALSFGLFAMRANPEMARNPIIYADVPDAAIIRVADTYYMSSTTMHLSPGVPIMKSKDLVNWNLVGYAYDTLADNEALRLENGANAYGRGSWASSLRHHDGVFYVSTFSSTTNRTHIFTTRDIERGPWKETSFSPSLHDHSLIFDDDGRVYMLYGANNLRLVELNEDLSGIKPDGFNEVVIHDASLVAAPTIGLPAEGTQLRKINGKYYVFNITWPKNDMRTVLVHRADSLKGPYEGRVALHDRGIAQGGLIDTPDGKWYAYLFRDSGAVGRIPYLVPVVWEDGWPVLGSDGVVPMTLDIPAGEGGFGNIVQSDEFDGDALPLAWQWNHNPDNARWSLAKRPGWLRIETGRVDGDLTLARNSLSQRTFGPSCSAEIRLDVSGMKDGDWAGIAAFQKLYGFVAVKMEGGSKRIVMVNADSGEPVEKGSVPLAGDTVRLRASCEFGDKPELARFYYESADGDWAPIGDAVSMKYTLPHFMGYRFTLFNFATKGAGGWVDFDYYRIDGVE